MKKLRIFTVSVVVFLAAPLVSLSQSTDASLMGRVIDPQKAAVPAASIEATNVDTNLIYTAKTNNDGLFSIPNLPPGNYRVSVAKEGFKSIVKPGIVLHVQDVMDLNFDLAIGSISEVVTVTAGGVNIDTTDGSVSTVVDRNFVENIPLNGRSLQPLIALTPGVVLTAATNNEPGQFSVDGQRADANYFTVDGVSANFGSGAFSVGQQASGALPAFNGSGSTNSLVSIDSIEEFRVDTSSYSPEFGRTPGGQISIATRSGTNQFHGDVFDYFRNNVLDANSWFYDQIVETLSAGTVPKPALRQNDFGGVIGGPILRDRTFFFFSYEGLRLVQPTTGEETVPDVAFRESLPAAVQPLVNALPIPNGKDFGNGTALFLAAYSNPSRLNATSLRIDHKLSSKFTLFGRYDYAPSESTIRADSLSTLISNNNQIQTLTIGSDQLISTDAGNDFRFNFSRSTSNGTEFLDNFGGAVPPVNSSLFPSSYSPSDGLLALSVSGAGGFNIGTGGGTLIRQLNFVDGLSVSRGRHQLKFGVDYRRLASATAPSSYYQGLFFFGLSDLASDSVPFALIGGFDRVNMVFQNFSVYAQDSWKLNPRLTLTYGLRWEINPALHGTDGTPLYTLQNINDPPNIALAPAGTPFYKTNYGNFAPRIGLAAQVFSRRGFQTVVRGGFGIFYDLGTGILAGGSGYFPYLRYADNFGVPYPIPAAEALPPPFSASIPAGGVGNIFAASPNLTLPRTYQWNLAVQQSLGVNQSLTVTYLGAVGRDLLRNQVFVDPNPNFQNVSVTTNSATSSYNALQIQYQRRLSSGLQALGFYSWSHCIDDASNDSSSFGDNPNMDRGNCDFDIRNSFHGVLTYDIPTPSLPGFGRAILGGWAIDTIATAQSAPPVDLNAGANIDSVTNNITVRPDVVPGEPFYLYGAQCLQAPPVGFGQVCPGGKGLNPEAFTGVVGDGRTPPGTIPVDANGNPLRQGTLGRNVVRGFGLTQVDFALRRQFDFSERWNLQFSAEFFNILNHPNFGSVDTNLQDSPGTFGQATQTLADSLSQGTASTSVGFNPLYQVGGPRSIQLALKLKF
jgi:carboxypeptidase family protein